MANNVTLERIYPFFIARNLAASIEFYNQNSVLRQMAHTSNLMNKGEKNEIHIV